MHARNGRLKSVTISHREEGDQVAATLTSTTEYAPVGTISFYLLIANSSI